MSLADSYTPTVSRSCRCAATSTRSTASLTACILPGTGKQPVSSGDKHRSPPHPAVPRGCRTHLLLSQGTSSSRVMVQL